MPRSTPLYTPTKSGLVNGPLTIACPLPADVPQHLACGNNAVNTMLPAWQPTGTFAPVLPALGAPTIGDRLSAKSVDWAWYAGGWSNAAGDKGGPGWTNGGGADGTACTDPNAATGAIIPYCPDKLFQPHHQPFNYYSNYAPGMPARAAHLRDEEEFQQLVQGSGTSCQLRPVSFVKPLGEENEHPGYASEHQGSTHLVDLLQAIEGSSCAGDTMVVVTYDEFGGQWDHVSPPGQGSSRGPHDV